MNIEHEDEQRSSSVSEIQLEVTDEEIRKLSEYFEKSRSDIQKKVDLLLAKDTQTHSKVTVSHINDKNASEQTSQNQTNLNKESGRPITLENATALRELSVGSSVHSFSSEWRRAKFVFRNDDELFYGLYSEKNGSKGLILAVQTILLKNLIERSYLTIDVNRILRPSETERRNLLAKSLSEILWRAGEFSFACVALNSDSNCFELKSLTRSNYIGDGVTERLQLYEFSDFKLLEAFIRKKLILFQKEDGCILFLYSLFLSRRIDILKCELQGTALIGEMEECRLALFNLVVSGYATPYLHNGNAHYDLDGQSLNVPQLGIKSRSDVGILYWNENEEDGKRTEVGSMLKTPKYPIWLVIMGKNLIAILFNTNLDLINNWRFEQSFALHFYTGMKKQEQEIKISIETRDLSNILNQTFKINSKYSNFNFKDDEKEAEIVAIIKTKWPGCEILNTNGKDIMQLL